ncbi:hypothetical protein B0H13DRAFT_2351701 [Mycena leptocephala]|nr:hypothetical protein B0H13DRAFT_2351701 [Mycena leptocephala]
MSEGHRRRPRGHRDQREEHHDRRSRRSQSPIPSSSRSCHPPRRPRSPPPSRRQSPLIDRHGLQAPQPSLPTLYTKHLPLALPSDAPAQAATSETRCTLSDSPVTFPALLYIEGTPLDEDDPNDFVHTAPRIATALKESQIAPATAVTPPSPSPSESTNPTSSARRPPQYWFCRQQLADGQVLAWPLISGGPTPEAQARFLQLLDPVSRAAVIPIDAQARAVFPDLSQYCPVPSMTTYTNPVDVPNQPNPLKGFLIGCADARFSLDAVYFKPHSFEVPVFRFYAVDAYLGLLAHEPEAVITGYTGGPEGRGGGGPGEEGRTGGGEARRRDDIGHHYDYEYEYASSCSTASAAAEARFLASLGGPNAGELMRVAETLEAERDAAERERWECGYRDAQQRVVRYREDLAGLEGTFADPDSGEARHGGTGRYSNGGAK